MGGLWAARIADAGHQVTVVDVSAEVVDAVRAAGMEVVEKDGSVTHCSLAATMSASEAGPQDLVFVFVKGPHTRTAVESLRLMLGNGTTVVTLQNGWGNADTLAGFVPPERLVIGVTYHAATVQRAGRVLHPGIGPSYLGSYIDGGNLDPARQVAVVMMAAGFETEVTSEVKTAIWRKLIHNSACLAVSALTELRAGPLVESPLVRELIDDIARESTAVARAHGHDIDVDERIERIHEVLSGAGMGVPSMLADALARRHTEIATINGAVVRAAREVDIDVPLNAAMVALIEGMEQGWGAADA